MLNIAVIGATGAVGREMLAELEDSTLTDMKVSLFASSRSAGEVLYFKEKAHEVKAYARDAMREFDYCLMSAGGAFSKQESAFIVEMGATVIDNSSAWRMDPQVPLVVPEVNADILKNWKKGIIANPNCSTIQMVVPLRALHAAYGLEHVCVSTYQSVSGTGQKGIKELSQQIEAQFKFQDLKSHVYAQPIAFNVLPAIDKLDENGHAFEEEKMVRETRKILSLPKLDALATTVRVPVFTCHSESVAVRLQKPVNRAAALETLGKTKGIKLHIADDHAAFPTPRSVAGERNIHVTRVRTPLDQDSSNWLQFWVVADNLKKGAATNAVQILECLSGQET